MERECVLLFDPRREVSPALDSYLERHGYLPLRTDGPDVTDALCRKYSPKLVLLNGSGNGSGTDETLAANILGIMKTSRGKNVGSVLLSDRVGLDCDNLDASRYVKDKNDVQEILCAVRETSEKVDLMDERDDFLDRLIEYSERLEEMVAEKTAKLQAANDRLRKLSVTDDLTGIFNRRYFFERLNGDMNLMFRYGHPISVLLIDIDDFKRVNDCKGHLVGDAVLRDFARTLVATVRKGETVARYGGEEFAVILPYTPEDGAMKAGEKIRHTVEGSFFGGGERLRMTVSIGVAEVYAAGDADEALSRADLALYDAKAAGKNRVASVSIRQEKDCS